MSDQSAQSASVREAAPGGAFGPNAWLVDDMYDQFRRDPQSVSESWREFFHDYVPGGHGGLAGSGSGSNLDGLGVRESSSSNGANGAAGLAAQAGGATAPSFVAPAAAAAPATAVYAPSQAPAAPPPSPGAVPVVPSVAAVVPHPVAEEKEQKQEDRREVLTGASKRIAANMEASLSVPTATSVRSVAAKLLQVNRTLLNRHLTRISGTKVSFTHLIGYAVVRALVDEPVLNSSYVADVDAKGHPGVIRHEHVGLGLAVDVSRPDGSRTLLVPVIREAERLDFRTFVLAYEELVRKVHAGKISPDDFAGATATLTNPGTLGTVQSVPRLMPGQGVIVGVGSIGMPPELQAADPRALAALGVGPVVTITSTYDHRIIQGAESGLFLSHISELLQGEHRFYDEVFASMDVPFEPVRWMPDTNATDDEMDRLEKQVHVQSLINMYRVRGHLIADLDPLAAEPAHLHPELDPATYGLTLWDLDREFVVAGLGGRRAMTLGQAIDVLRDAYCRTLAIEYMHMQDPEQKQWIQQHVEGVSTALAPDEQRHILDRLNAAEAFEKFLHTRYVGQKRFGLEGAESTIVILDEILSLAANEDLESAVMGMAHRGRLNVLANIVGKSYREIFREFEGDLDPDSVQGSGDVKYHKGASGLFVSQRGDSLPVSMASNPSHLEAVDPVVVGMVRARQDHLKCERKFTVLSLLVHGDAAFAGQGVVAETLELSQLQGYRTGGTIHVVINNQLGFTTAPASARSSVYPTDVGKIVQAPIIHVNGDDPEACFRAARLAFGFRQAFHKDVVIDLVCYRRFGHNEGDDPSYTQPRMYAIIEKKRSVRKRYTEVLVRRGDITLEEAENALDDFAAKLQAALDETRQAAPPQVTTPLPVAPPAETTSPMVTTGIARNEVVELAAAATAVPEGFHIHPKLLRQFEQRAKMVADDEVDWALGEAIALGSLVLEGTDVRLSGQDTRRGTFSQRHAVLVDHETGQEWVPLAHLHGQDLGTFRIHDSLLSEYAALGFEYGYSVESPGSLICWEAQFGDFANGAQVIIDNFLVAAEDKWGQHSGLVLLLPHGYEGQGPEHSSARLERFLTLSARGNMRIAQPTTAAQYFHLLRSQVRGAGNRPLILATPKSLLRAVVSRSAIDELTTGGFRAVLDDPATGALPPISGGQVAVSRIDPSAVGRLVLCSGKIAFDAMAWRERESGPEAATGRTGTAVTSAIVRLEELYPWPELDLLGVLDRYPSATELVWLQDEPANMGPWPFAHERLHRIVRDRFTLRHVSRPESASPATGSGQLHAAEHDDLLLRALS
jgi:multifunctional 2-oxoglutarate metabolism enzyme